LLSLEANKFAVVGLVDEWFVVASKLGQVGLAAQKEWQALGNHILA